MGKHKKSKKHKDKKKSKKEYSSSSEDEWVEKKINSNSSSDDEDDKKSYSRKRQYTGDNYEATSSSEDDKRIRNKQKSLQHCIDKSYDTNKFHATNDTNDREIRDDWMNLPTAFTTVSNSSRRHEREEAKKLQREKQQYDPRQCSRELNPYWKDGGDGLPKFKKPSFEVERDNSYRKKDNYSNSGSSKWRKQKDTETHSSKEKIEKYETNLSNEKSDDKALSEKELNLLGAKLVKAEIMGNTKLVNDLKEKLDKARASQQNTKSETQEDEILLIHTDSQGRSQPLKQQSEYGEPSNYKRKKKVETHKDGQRVRYFPDDDKYSLKQMFETEKYNTVEDQNSEFIKMASKVPKNDDLDDIFADNIRKKVSDSKIDSKNRDRAINAHNKIERSLDNCNKCIQSEMMLKHLMVSMKETSYLALPPYEPLTEGHCFIIPIQHVPCATQLDENEWSEILDTRKALVRFFQSKNQEVIFFETAISLHRFPHMYIECIPMPKEDGDMAPIYFKKAIDESETEWAHNKKLVSLKGRDVRQAIPKGLPYFSVSFGMEEGFAHVIEDEQLFPINFAQEIIGGMLDLHHSKWRKPKRQSFDEQSKRVLTFSKDWKDFDPT